MEEFEEERVGVHKAVNLHSRRLITTYYASLESSQIDISRDSLLRTQVDNFQLKLHTDSFLHSCRTLYTVASDLSMNRLLHTIDDQNTQEDSIKQKLSENLFSMRQEISNNEKLLEAPLTKPIKQEFND